MNTVRTWISAFLVVGGSTATFAADVHNGEQIALRWCSACHVVAPGQSQANADVPPFSAIAARPNFDEHAIAFFLLDPHPKMPSLGLSRKDTQDLAAYIGSLR